MPAMTMPFEARDTNDLRGLNPGDFITFHMVVTPDHGWVEDITKILQTRREQTNGSRRSVALPGGEWNGGSVALPDCHEWRDQHDARTSAAIG